MTEPCRVLVADPPWGFGDKLPGDSRGAEKNYRVLSQEDIEKFPLPDLADDALLFLWRVSSQVEEAYRVVRAWGFVPKTEIVWLKYTKTGEKLHFGMGRYVRLAHETCIVASRRRGNSLIKDRSIRSVFFEEAVLEASYTRHSAKPDKFYEIVETLAEGPYVELFSRKQRPGWTCFGDEI